MKITKSEIELKVAGRPVKFNVYHNLPKTPGLRIEDAVENWVTRTTNPTAISLCNYIMSKRTGYFCITESEYKRLHQP